MPRFDEHRSYFGDADPRTVVLDGDRYFDLVVWYEESARSSPVEIGKTILDTPSGRKVALSQVADVQDTTGPNTINREHVERRIVVFCNVQGRDLGSVVADIQAAVGPVEERLRGRPGGYRVEYGGQFEAQRSATVLISVLALVSVAGVFVVLYLLYPSVRVSLQILNAVPTAFIGGVIALILTNQTLTVASLVGFVSLGGIAVRNGILLVTHYFHLMKYEGDMRKAQDELKAFLQQGATAGAGQGNGSDVRR